MSERVTRADLEQAAVVLNGIHGNLNTEGYYINRANSGYRLMHVDGSTPLGGYISAKRLYERVSAYIDGIRTGLRLAADREGVQA